MKQHQIKNIAAIRGMRGPAQGQFVVFVYCPANGQELYGPAVAGGFSPTCAIKIVRDNPRLELQVIEKWILD